MLGKLKVLSGIEVCKILEANDFKTKIEYFKRIVK